MQVLLIPQGIPNLPVSVSTLVELTERKISHIKENHGYTRVFTLYYFLFSHSLRVISKYDDEFMAFVNPLVFSGG